MQRLLIPTAALLLCAGAVFALQERVSKPKAKDFGAILTEAKTAFDAAHYGTALGRLRDATAIVTKERRKAVLAAFPAAPEGWKLEAEEPNDEAVAQLAGLAFMGGAGIEGKYVAVGGNGRINVSILADSPLARMFSMWIANPAMLDKDAELVKYGAHNAVLRTRTKGSSYEMQLLVGEDLVQIDVSNASDEFLFKLWNQAAVDKVAAALAH
ncbi:MAG: hypothetical protein JNL28_15300 [Planctomycetes bacterium]|nr:hypothetical protein [Planctomycetota bacterium]